MSAHYSERDNSRKRDERGRRDRSTERSHDSLRKRNRAESTCSEYSTTSSRHDYRDNNVHRSNRRYNTHNRRSRSPKNDRQSREDHHFRRPEGRENRRREERPIKNDNGSENEQLDEEEPPPPEIKPNFELTGALAKYTNTINGVVVKYNEPSEAMKPRKSWRLYPFKGEQTFDPIEVSIQSAFLIGRDRRVCEIPIDHPSCSSQHAVLQYRSVQLDREDGTTKKVVRPYIIDLDSANGTFLNNQKIDPRRYVELRERDSIKFAFSTREYILLHENSAAQ